MYERKVNNNLHFKIIMIQFHKNILFKDKIYFFLFCQCLSQ